MEEKEGVSDGPDSLPLLSAMRGGWDEERGEEAAKWPKEGERLAGPVKKRAERNTAQTQAAVGRDVQ